MTVVNLGSNCQELRLQSTDESSTAGLATQYVIGLSGSTLRTVMNYQYRMELYCLKANESLLQQLSVTRNDQKITQ